MPENKTGVGPTRGGATFKLQGHTASAFGSEPGKQAKGEVGKEPRDVKP